MRVLVACEFSGIVRDAFRERGHDAWSCDLLPTERPGPHHQGDVREILGEGWDLMIAHPPCTHLAVSGARWFHRKGREQGEALDFVRLLLDAPVPRIALENPVGVISRHVRRFDQLVHPYMFGDDVSKSTCLWLKNLPPLTPTNPVAPRIVDGRPRWGSQLDNGQSRLGPGRQRSRTYPGMAAAMAEQWGGLS